MSTNDNHHHHHNETHFRHPMATAPASLPAPSSTSSTSSTNLKGGPSIPPPHLSSTFASSVPPPVPKKKYRDRAEERRQGLNLDYQDTATLLQTLRGHGHGHASLPLGSTRSSLLSASSLLSLDDEVEVEVKKTLSKNEHLGSPDTSNFTSSQHPLVVHSTAGSSKKRLLTPFIKTILEAALKKPKPPSFSNPHCYPGRMAYVFPLPSSNPSISLPPHNSGSGDHGPRLSSPPSSSVLDSSHVTVVLRSTDQVKPLFKEQVEIIDQILTFLATKKKKKSHSHVPSSSVSEDPLAPSSEDPLHFLPPENHPVPPLHDVLNHHKITPPLHLVNQEDEDDIFADAGRDYSIPIEKEVIMTTKDELFNAPSTSTSTSTSTSHRLHTTFLQTQSLIASRRSQLAERKRKHPTSSFLFNEEQDEIDLDPSQSNFWKSQRTSTYFDYLVEEEEEEEEEGEVKACDSPLLDTQVT